MAQICLYLDDLTMGRLRDESKKASCSLSRYVGNLINSKGESASWPEGYWAIYGSLSDDTFRLPDELDPSLDGPLPAF